MATDPQVLTRRKLVQRLAVRLDEAEPTRVSNNDVRRMIEHIDMVIAFLRAMEKYPADVSRYNPVAAIMPGHLSDALLDGFCASDTRTQMPIPDQQLVQGHVGMCSFCKARMEFFQTRLIAGQHVRPGNPNEPRTPSLDIGNVSNPTTLNPHIGITAGASWEDE